MPSKNNNVKYFVMCHKCFIHHSALTQKIETKLRIMLLSLKLMTESELLIIKMLLVKVALKIDKENYFLSILF